MSAWLGREVPVFKGTIKESPASLIGPENFQHLENVDWEGGAVIDRPGQAKVNSVAAMPASVDFMFDTRDVGKPV